jgi:sec-independent protein translocase protein TatA
MLENIGTGELLMIALIAFIFFGPKKMPELGRNLGKGIRELRNAMRGIQDELTKVDKGE